MLHKPKQRDTLQRTLSTHASISHTTTGKLKTSSYKSKIKLLCLSGWLKLKNFKEQMDSTPKQECLLIDIEAYRKKYLPARFSINSIFILIGGLSSEPF